MNKFCNKQTLVFSFLVMLGTHANAVTIFTDRSLFLAALIDITIIDFENVDLGGASSVPVIGDPWLADGIVFDDAIAGDNMAIGSGGSGSGMNQNIYTLMGEDADIDITLINPVFAFGLEVYSNNGQSPNERITFFDTSDSVIADIEMPLTGPSSGAFIGLIADTAEINHILFADDLDGDYVGIGEVVFTTAVPLPSAMLLFISGILGMFGLRWSITKKD